MNKNELDQARTEVMVRPPFYTGEILDRNLLGAFMLPEKERKIALDMNHLAILARHHQGLPAPYFIDFINKAQLTGADPRRNEIYLIPYERRIKEGNNWVTVAAANVIFAYQFFVSRASRFGSVVHYEVRTEVEQYFNPYTMSAPVLTPVSTCRVFLKDRADPIVYRARLPEFVVTNHEGVPNKVWKTKPYMMLEKCAVSNAMRWAEPAVMAGMYTAEEMVGEESLPVIEKPYVPQVINVNSEPAPKKAEAVYDYNDQTAPARPDKTIRSKKAAVSQAQEVVAHAAESAPVAPPIAATEPELVPPPSPFPAKPASVDPGRGYTDLEWQLADSKLRFIHQTVIDKGGAPFYIVGTNPFNFLHNKDYQGVLGAIAKMEAWNSANLFQVARHGNPPPKATEPDVIPDVPAQESYDEEVTIEPPRPAAPVEPAEGVVDYKVLFLRKVQEDITKKLVPAAAFQKAGNMLSDVERCRVVYEELLAGNYSSLL